MEKDIKRIIAIIVVIIILISLLGLAYWKTGEKMNGFHITPKAFMNSEESVDNPGNWTLWITSMTEEIPYDDVYITFEHTEGTFSIGSPMAGLDIRYIEYKGTLPNYSSVEYIPTSMNSEHITSEDIIELRAEQGNPWNETVIQYYHIPTHGLIAQRTLD